MGDVIINQGKTNTLVITLPAKGDVDWASKVRKAFQDICDHDHTGGIKGKKITGDALADNTITINNIDLSSVNLNTFLDIADGTTIPSGSVLLWSEENQEWYPSTIQNVNSSSNVYVITNDTDLNGYTPTPGDILYVDSQGQPNAFTNGVVGAADFSHYTKNLKGVKIISNDIPLVMAELDECKIMASQDITLQSTVNNSQVNSGAYKIILDGCNVRYSSLQGGQLADTDTSNGIRYSQGFFDRLNITSNSTVIYDTSKIEAARGILSLAGYPPFSGTTTKPVTIVNQEVRTQVLPETASTNEVLTWNGSAWVGQSLITKTSTTDNSPVIYNSSTGFIESVATTKIRQVSSPYAVGSWNAPKLTGHYEYTFPLRQSLFGQGQLDFSDTLDLTASSVTVQNGVGTNHTIDLENNHFKIYISQIDIYMNDGFSNNYSAFSYREKILDNFGGVVTPCFYKTIVAPQSSPSFNSYTTSIGGPITANVTTGATPFGDFWSQSWNAGPNRAVLRAIRPIEVSNSILYHTSRVEDAYGSSNGYSEGSYCKIYLVFEKIYSKYEVDSD